MPHCVSQKCGTSRHARDGPYGITSTVAGAWWRSARPSYTEADIGHAMIGGDETAADHFRSLRYRVNDQMSIFSAISIASSTSMPR